MVRYEVTSQFALVLGTRTFKPGSTLYFDRFYNGSDSDYRLWEGNRKPSHEWIYVTEGYIRMLVKDGKLSLVDSHSAEEYSPRIGE